MMILTFIASLYRSNFNVWLWLNNKGSSKQWHKTWKAKVSEIFSTFIMSWNRWAQNRWSAGDISISTTKLNLVKSACVECSILLLLQLKSCQNKVSMELCHRSLLRHWKSSNVQRAYEMGPDFYILWITER